MSGGSTPLIGLPGDSAVRASRRARPRPGALVLLAALAVAGAGASGPVAAQSLLERTPNLSGGWVGPSGTLHFNFMHRFSVSPAPERKVANVPTLTVAAGLPARLLLGAHYATNSRLVPRYPNEWEFFARHAPLAQSAGAPLDLSVQAGYNLAARGADGEVVVARRQGALRVLLVGRVLSDAAGAGRARVAAGGGAVLRLGRWVALAGDAVTLLDRDGEERPAWSGGLHIGIPHTPHTLSLQAANTNATTLQGTSRGERTVRYGFEFTVPMTPSRWFGGGGAAPAPPPILPGTGPADPTEADADEVVRAELRGFAFAPARVEVTAGTTVEWTNHDPVVHTVTAGDGGFDSGPIEPGATWRHTFETPGTYALTCTPHPFMRARVVVRRGDTP